ncbi:MAG: DUF4215 domain-containing protein [Deltaproteobacteria bacterium]|nr:DUF4215 domain-containing protein [Deltaproteobacteria bacterium]
MPMRGEGDACDPLAITSVCAPGLACAGAAPDAARCSATADPGCGAGRAVVDLTSRWEAMGQVSYAGSFRGARDLGAVTCGSGDAEEDVVHVVRLARAARITSVGAINIGAAVSVRAGCLDEEIGCSLSMRVPEDHVFPSGSDVYLVAQRMSSHAGDEYVLDVVREMLLDVGEPCTEATGAPPRSRCVDGLVCDETSSRCRPTVCRDGRAEGLEGCDDGNDVASDGCSPTCELEDQGEGGDGCPGATLRLVPGPDGTHVAYATGSTVGHDDDTDGARCPGVFMSADVRYELSVPEAGRLTLSFDIPVEWDPAVRLHAGACGGDRVGAPVLACESSATRPEPWSISADVDGGAHSITIDHGLGRSGGPYALFVTLTP